MPVIVPPSGSPEARIMIVGEAPGEEEERRGAPFVGASGMEMDRMLHEAGILRTECFVTNVARSRPYENKIQHFIAQSQKAVKEAPKGKFHPFRDGYVTKEIIEGAAALEKEISLVQPNLIIAFGNTPLWVLNGRKGIMKHRGSMLYATPPYPKVKVIPTYHPAYILRDWASRQIAVTDLKRAARFRNGEPYPHPKWAFSINPSFSSVCRTLEYLISITEVRTIQLDFDLETKNGHIDCAGISWSDTEAICIPFMARGRPEGMWNLEEENLIIWYLRKLLTHPNVQVVGQNLLYDSQYTYRHWLFVPNVYQDTMISQHVLWAGLKKSLDFQASLYCDYYVQWKPDKEAWAEGK